MLGRMIGFLRGDDLGADQMDGGREVRLIGVMVAIGFVSATVFHVVYGLMRGWRYPFNTFMFDPGSKFGDFLSVFTSAQVYGPPDQRNTIYSPFAHLMVTLTTLAPEALVWAAMNVVFLVVLVLVLWHGVTRRAGSRTVRWALVAVLTCLSYPVLFALELANIEMLMFVLLAAFAYLYFARHSNWAWLPLSCAVASKYWYAVFIFIFVLDRRWRPVFLCVGTAVAANLGSAVVLSWLSGWSFVDVLRNTRSTLGSFAGLVGGLMPVQHGHSLWGLIAMIDRGFGQVLWRNPHTSQWYALLAGLIFALVLVRLDRFAAPPWLRLTVLLTCGLLLPYQSHDYTAIHLFLPLALLGAWGVGAPGGTRVAMLFGLLLVPMSYGMLIFDTTVSVIIYPIVLMALLVVVLRLAVVFGPAARRQGSFAMHAARLTEAASDSGVDESPAVFVSRNP